MPRNPNKIDYSGGFPQVFEVFASIRSFATEDPRAFLRQASDGAIIDEVHRAPALFPTSMASSMPTAGWDASSDILPSSGRGRSR